MDNHISPEMKAILNQLDAMKDSVIIAGRSEADQNNESHASIKALRCELECANNHNDSLRKQLKSESKIAEASTVLMIISSIASAVWFIVWMLS